jgi:hypothetical protein
METVKFHFFSFELMKIRIRNGSDNANNNSAVKAKAAMPIAGILAAAALMAGLLSLIGGETAIAQENMTAATDQMTTAGNATMAGAANATNATMAGAANATNATMAGAANATEGAAGAANATGEAGEGLCGILEGIFGGGG